MNDRGPDFDAFEISQFPDAPNIPAYYRHYKGEVYRILHTARVESSGDCVVVYASRSGRVWVRPISEFLGMTTDPDTGQSIRRFQPLFRDYPE